MNVAGVARGRLALARAALWTRSRGRLRVREGAASVLLGVLLATLLAWALGFAFSGLRATGLPEPAARALVGWLFAATFAGVVVFDLHQALAVLVAAPDLDLLRAAPLTPRALATLRLADALPRSLPLVLTLALPATIGFAFAYGAPAAGAGGVALALLALWLAPLGIGLALALPLARALPPARARDLLGLLSTFALVGAWLANALLVPRAGLVALPDASGGVPFTAPPAWSPPAWAAAALATGTADAAALARLALLAAAGLALAVWSTRLHLSAALDRTHDAPRRVVRAGATRVASHWLAAFLARDGRLFVRQWSVAGDVIAASLLWMLLPLLAVEVFPAGAAEIARAMLVLLATGIGYEVGARALAFERAGLAWVRLAPLGPLRWVLGRLAGIALLAGALLLAAGTSVTLAFRLPAGLLPGLVVWPVAAAAVSIGVGLLTGAAFADPSWSHPRAMLSAPGRVVGTALLVVQASGWLWLAGTDPAPPPGLLLLGAGALAAVLVTLAARTLGRREF